MKKTIYFLALFGLILGACDKIDEPYLEPLAAGGDNKVTITIDFLDDLTGNYDLNVFIIEDDITAPQKNDEPSIGPTPDWLDYEHNHILRASLTGNWGIDLADDPANGSQFISELSFGIEDDWVQENLSLLAFITNGGTLEIVQVAETELDAAPAQQSKRVVLLEEFTGHLCVNCPEALKLAGDLKQTYGDQLLLLTIHAGDLAEPSESPFDTDFRTSTGTAIFNQFTPVGVPTGMVNRADYLGSVVLFKDDWQPAAKTQIEQPQQASISISVELAE